MTHRLLIALPLLLVSPFTLWAEDWPKWGGARGDGTWQGPRLPEKWPSSGLKTKWSTAIGGGYGGVAVVGDRVYVMDRQTMPTERERLLCFEAESGQPVWVAEYPVAYGKLDYGNGPRVTPTVHEGLIYILGAVGHVGCVRASDGEIVWQHDLVREGAAQIPEWGLAASPVVWKNLVFIHPGARETDAEGAKPTSSGSCLIAFDRLTGKEVWRTGDDPAGYATPILCDAPSGTQLVLWSPRHVLGIDPEEGTELWKVPYKVTYGVSIATPIYREGLLLVSGYWEGSKAIRLGPEPTSAKIEWEETKVLRGLMAMPLYRQGLVYSFDKQYGLTCFELATGKKLWDDDNRLTPRGRNPQASLVWLGDTDRVVALNSEGNLILARLTRAGYREESRTHLISPTAAVPIWAHPAYAGNCVYARNEQELKCAVLAE